MPRFEIRRYYEAVIYVECSDEAMPAILAQRGLTDADVMINEADTIAPAGDWTIQRVDQTDAMICSDDDATLALQGCGGVLPMPEIP